MRSVPSFLVLGAFALVALASLTNAACSAPTSVDQGTTEGPLVSSPYGYGPSPYGGYHGHVGQVDDTAY